MADEKWGLGQVRERRRTVLFSGAQCEQCPSVPLTQEEARHIRCISERVFSMAKCPACEHEVAMPFLHEYGCMRWLACPHCAAKLERKSPRYLVALSSFMMAHIALGGLGHRYRIIPSVLLVALMVVILC